MSESIPNLESDLAINSTTPQPDSINAPNPTPPVQPEAVKRVFQNSELLSKILGYLNNGEPRELVRNLSVSRSFFHASASNLCRRIEVPLYEFSSAKEREPLVTEYGCVSCDGEQPVIYDPPRNATVHRAMQPGISREVVQAIHPTYRAIFPATPTMKEMYRHVHVVTVEPHVLCDRLAISHPLPLVRTVIVRGGNNQVCRPSIRGAPCGFIPNHPFRLVLDGLCSGMICRFCTCTSILSPLVETLVLRLQPDTHQLHHRSRNLPSNFNPQRLVFLFPQERLYDDYGPDYRYGRKSRDYNHAKGRYEEDYIVAFGPGQGSRKDTTANMFYQIAKMALLVSKDSKIYVVGADQAALRIQGLERHDRELERLRSMVKQRRSSRNSHNFTLPAPLSHSQGFILPRGAHWVLDSHEVQATRWVDRHGEISLRTDLVDYAHWIDDVHGFQSAQQWMQDPVNSHALPVGGHWILDVDNVEATRWVDSNGGIHDIDEILEFRDADDDAREDEDRWRDRHGELALPWNACYSKIGRIVSFDNHREFSPEHQAIARDIVERRVLTIKSLVHDWLDHILDSRIPLEDWKTEQSKWDSRDQFERHLFHLKAQKDQETNQKWHDNHKCWVQCHDHWIPEVPESEDEDEEGSSVYRERDRAHRGYVQTSWYSGVVDGTKKIVQAKEWRRRQKWQKTRDEIEDIRKTKHGKIQFINTFQYHKMEGNDDEMDDPAMYI